MASTTGLRAAWPATVQGRRDPVAGLAVRTQGWRPIAGPTVLIVTAIWLSRRLLFGAGLPAGTDVLDVLARARQNASWNVLLSPWSPSGLGLPRQTSLDNLLGLLVMVTGSPARTVEVLLFTLLVISGLSSYWVVRRWYGDRLAATIAAVVYMTSQASLGRVASGWLHYELLVALAPLLIYLWVSLLDRFSLTHALVLAVLVAAVLFARQDVFLWLVPAFALYVPIRFIAAPPRERPVLQLGRTLAVVAPTIVALSLYFILPLRAGIRAPWVSTGQVFEAIRFNLLDRSLDAYQSLLGLGRDLGYLPFNGEEWWNFHPWFGQPVYYGIAALVVAAALSAVWIRRDALTLYLVALAVFAAFLGKGIRGPVGEPYWFGVRHIPIFGSLRGPNRWLIEQAFSYATLAALTLTDLYRRLQTPVTRRVAPVILVAGIVVALLPVGPTLISGFRTWAPTPAARQLMQTVAQDPGTFAVASVPYDQSMRFVSTGGYQGWEHDLGVESPLFTGHPAMSTNSWDRRGSDFVDFTSTLLSRHDAAFGALLGSVGVKYLLGFDYTPDSAVADSRRRARAQLLAVARQPDLSQRTANNAGRLYELPQASPLLSFRTNLAVILGGREGLAAFADQPGIQLSAWATETADDLVSSSQSVAPLTRALDRANVIVLSGADLRDLSVLATHAMARVPGITSDPGLDRRAGILLTDESARRGSLADETVPPPGLVASASTTFKLERPRRLELWTRILRTANPGAVSFAVDGTTLRTLVPLEPGTGAFAWTRVAVLSLTRGSHVVRVAGHGSAFGGTFETDETRLIDPAVRRTNDRRLQAAVTRNAAKVEYLVDLSQGPFVEGRSVPQGNSAAKFWQLQDPHGISTRVVHAAGNVGAELTLTGTRRFYTVAFHRFGRPQSWSGRTYALLRYRGSGDGTHYNVLVDFNEQRTDFASFPLVDSSPGWHTLAMPIKRRAGTWSHILSLRVATASKSDTGRITLGGVRLLFPTRLVERLQLPTPVNAAPRIVGVTTSSYKVRVLRDGGRSTVTISMPRRGAAGQARLWIPALHRVHARPPVAVSFHADGPAGWRFAFHSPRRGFLVLNQTYDPHWVATGGSRARLSVPVTSLVNGFSLGPGNHVGVVQFRGRSLVRLGILLSLGALGITLLALTVLALRRRRSQGLTVLRSRREAVAHRLAPTDIERSLLIAAAALGLAGISFWLSLVVVVCASVTRAAGWWRPTLIATALILASPIWIAVHRPEVPDRAAVVATAAMAIAIGRLLYGLRRSVAT